MSHSAAHRSQQLTKEADLLFASTEHIIDKYVKYLESDKDEDSDTFDKPFIFRINNLYFVVTCDIVDSTYDSHAKIKAIEEQCKNTTASAANNEISIKSIYETAGFLLYGIRRVFIAYVANLSTFCKKIDTIPMKNISLGLDSTNATVYPVYVSDEEKEKIHLDKCMNTLLSQATSESRGVDWDVDVRITTKKIDIIDKFLADKKDEYVAYDNILRTYKRIGIVVNEMSVNEINKKFNLNLSSSDTFQH